MEHVDAHTERDSEAAEATLSPAGTPNGVRNATLRPSGQPQASASPQKGRRPDEYCLQCMNPLDSTGTCASCKQRRALPHAPHRLKPGTILANRYLVGATLGQGGFGITYIGRDLTLDARVAIKEYYPVGYANRNTAVSDAISNTGDESWAFIQNGKHHFLNEARALARFHGNSGIVNVHNYFEGNATAYIIMDYLNGETLKQHLERHSMSADEVFALFRPIMDALEQVHAKQVIHRDISPDNIMILNDGSLRLIDFGATRIIDYEDQRTVSMVLKAGYAPEEQYRAKGELGPWTDIYALCATMYKAITGVTPDESLQRLFSGEMLWPSDMGIPIAAWQETVLKKGMAPHREDRYQCVSALKADIDRGAGAGDSTRGIAGVGVSAPDSSRLAGEDRQTLALQQAAGESAPPERKQPHALGRVRPAHVAGIVTCLVAAVLAAVLLLPAKATVAFDTAGGSAVDTAEIAKGSQIDAPDAPSRADYTFAGWYYDEARTQQAVFPLTVQEDTTLHAAWEKARAVYTVSYLDRSTKDEVAPTKTVDSEPVGSTVAAKALHVDGYKLDSDKKQSLDLTGDAGKDKLVFYYRKLVKYQVNYVNKDTGYDIKSAKTVAKNPEGATVTEKAPALGGYTLVSDSSKTLKLKRKTKDNQITFYYQREVVYASPSESYDGYSDYSSGSGGGSSSGSSGGGSGSSSSGDVEWAN